jgi:cell division GTPase FtsZ
VAETAEVDGLGKSFALNTSIEDLSAAKMIDPARKFKFQTIHGAAKNRNAAFEAFKSEYSRFIANVKSGLTNDSNIDDYDIIFVISSGGGGTGSGIAPVVSRMFRREFPNSYIVPVIVLPSIYERGIAQQNALDCLKEFEATEAEAADPNWTPFTIILADNSRIDRDLVEEKYNIINKEIVSNIKRLIKCDKTSRISNMDVADRKSMFSDPGILVIGSATVDMTDESPMLAAIKRAIDKTPMSADVTASVKRVALQCDCDKSLYTQANMIAAQSMFKNAAGVFEGYYGPDEEAGSTEPVESKILVAFSGARLPEKVILERESIVENAFKVPTEAAVEISKGNSSLKSAWGATTAQKAAVTPAADSSQNFDDVFAGLSAKRG